MDDARSTSLPFRVAPLPFVLSDGPFEPLLPEPRSPLSEGPGFGGRGRDLGTTLLGFGPAALAAGRDEGEEREEVLGGRDGVAELWAPVLALSFPLLVRSERGTHTTTLRCGPMRRWLVGLSGFEPAIWEVPTTPAEGAS